MPPLQPLRRQARANLAQRRHGAPHPVRRRAAGEEQLGVEDQPRGAEGLERAERVPFRRRHRPPFEQRLPERRERAPRGLAQRLLAPTGVRPERRPLLGLELGAGLGAGLCQLGRGLVGPAEPAEGARRQHPQLGAPPVRPLPVQLGELPAAEGERRGRSALRQLQAHPQLGVVGEAAQVAGEAVRRRRSLEHLAHAGEPPAPHPDLRQVVEGERRLPRAVAAGQEPRRVAEGPLGAGEVAGLRAGQPEVVPEAGRLVGREPPPRGKGARQMCDGGGPAQPAAGTPAAPRRGASARRGPARRALRAPPPGGGPSPRRPASPRPPRRPPARRAARAAARPPVRRRAPAPPSGPRAPARRCWRGRATRSRRGPRARPVPSGAFSRRRSAARAAPSRPSRAWQRRRRPRSSAERGGRPRQAARAARERPARARAAGSRPSAASQAARASGDARSDASAARSGPPARRARRKRAGPASQSWTVPSSACSAASASRASANGASQRKGAASSTCPTAASGPERHEPLPPGLEQGAGGTPRLAAAGDRLARSEEHRQQLAQQLLRQAPRLAGTGAGGDEPAGRSDRGAAPAVVQRPAGMPEVREESRPLEEERQPLAVGEAGVGERQCAPRRHQRRVPQLDGGRVDAHRTVVCARFSTPVRKRRQARAPPGSAGCAAQRASSGIQLP